MPTVAVKILERRLWRAQVPPSIPTTPTPESKYHYRSPIVAGIGINIPSLHISPSRVVSEFFSSSSCLKFLFTQVHLKLCNPGYFLGMDVGSNFSHQTLARWR